jgi:NAD-dependent dihydropyrimidine dehydrogenase PreA subunit
MKQRYLKNVSTLSLNASKCSGCGRCVEVCPHGVFAVDGKKARIEDLDLCMECGACQKNCATGAISVDAGVGCASAVLMGWLTGSEPTCGCADGDSEGSGCC